MEITQDVKVNVKKAQDMELLKEPMCPTPDVRLPFTRLSHLHLGPHILGS